MACAPADLAESGARHRNIVHASSRSKSRCLATSLLQAPGSCWRKALVQEVIPTASSRMSYTSTVLQPLLQQALERWRVDWGFGFWFAILYMGLPGRVGLQGCSGPPISTASRAPGPGSRIAGGLARPRIPGLAAGRPGVGQRSRQRFPATGSQPRKGRDSQRFGKSTVVELRLFRVFLLCFAVHLFFHTTSSWLRVRIQGPAFQVRAPFTACTYSFGPLAFPKEEGTALAVASPPEAARELRGNFSCRAKLCNTGQTLCLRALFADPNPA